MDSKATYLFQELKCRRPINEDSHLDILMAFTLRNHQGGLKLLSQERMLRGGFQASILLYKTPHHSRYQDSELLATVNFAELVYLPFRQTMHAPYNRFVPRPPKSTFNLHLLEFTFVYQFCSRMTHEILLNYTAFEN